MLDSKNKEIEELKEKYKRRDAEVDKQLAAAETIKTASADVSVQPGLTDNQIFIYRFDYNDEFDSGTPDYNFIKNSNPQYLAHNDLTLWV